MAKLDDGRETLEPLLARLATGDRPALDELIVLANDRMVRLARKMLRDFPGVKRWEETDDIYQNATLRLCKALQEVRPPTPDDFFRLAAAMIRRELLDLARKYAGPQGLGANYSSVAGESPDTSRAGANPLDPADDTHEPERLAAWTAFHLAVEKLPTPERDVFDLVHYQGLTQPEAAVVLGLHERTLKRRWLSARLRLHDALRGIIPEA